MILLTFLIGFLYYLISVVSTKRRTIIYIFFALALLFVTYHFYADIVRLSVFSRSRIYEIENYGEEGRVVEFRDYFQQWLPEENFTTILFGIDFFYSGFSENFGSVDTIDKGRILHSDFSNLLYTAGVLGAFLFLFLLYKYFKAIKLLKNYNTITKRIYQFMLITVLANLFSEGIDIGQNYFMFFAITGALVGYLENKKKEQIDYNE